MDQGSSDRWCRGYQQQVRILLDLKAGFFHLGKHFWVSKDKGARPETTVSLAGTWIPQDRVRGSFKMWVLCYYSHVTPTHVTPDSNNLEFCLNIRDCILHTSSLAPQKNPRPWRREQGLMRKEHVMLWVCNGKNCPGWLSLNLRRDRAGSRTVAAAAWCSPRMVVTVLLEESWSPFRGEKNVLHFYKINTNVCVFSFLLLLMITPFYLNSFNINAKLVIAIKLFYKSNLQETKLFIIYFQL